MHAFSELSIYLISPTVAIMQWRNEIASHTDGLKVLVWHGAARKSDVEELKKYDVVCLSPPFNLTCHPLML
jgi:SNF2 family DNA or RNA helicase